MIKTVYRAIRRQSSRAIKSHFNLSATLGKQYNGWRRAIFEIELAGSKYTIWFPKLSSNGVAASGSGWINHVSQDRATIEEYGGSPYIDNIGERLVFAKIEKGPYLFLGLFAHNTKRSRPEYHVFEKVADMADFTGDMPAIHYFTDENRVDDELVKQLKDSDFSTADAVFQFQGKILPVMPKRQVADRITYPRNPQTAKNALSHARYKCEWNSEHPTFIRRNSDVPYTEPHHLVPMSAQERFPVSLDVEENIVSLCSTCHNHIHYGKGAEKLISALYLQRKEALRTVGIDITMEELLSFYN